MSSLQSRALPRSLWAATARPGRPYPELVGAQKGEIAVVGGGFTGLSAALHLAERGKDVLLLEAAEPGWGASGRNGGQVIPGLKYDPDELEEMFGTDLGPRTVKTVGSTADLVFDLVGRYGIDCDAVHKGWIQPAHSEAALNTVSARATQWKRRGADVEILGREQVEALVGSRAYHGGWIDRRGGSLQPLSYARGLAAAASDQGARIFANSPALKVEQEGGAWKVTTPNGTATVNRIIIGTNAYSDDLWPGLKRTVVPVFSFQVATRPLSDNLRRSILPQGHAASDTRRLLRYYCLDREGRFVLGARGPFRDAPGPEDAARHYAAVRELFPQLGDVEYAYHWAGRVAMTADHLPHLHELAPGVHAGLGFNGRGVAMGTMMGRLLAQRASGVAAEEIDFPVLPLKPIPFHGFNRLAVRLAIQYYRLRDAME